MAFSQTSDVTLLITSCGEMDKLREAVQSFFYYNTYPLR